MLQTWWDVGQLVLSVGELLKEIQSPQEDLNSWPPTYQSDDLPLSYRELSIWLAKYVNILDMIYSRKGIHVYACTCKKEFPEFLYKYFKGKKDFLKW